MAPMMGEALTAAVEIQFLPRRSGQPRNLIATGEVILYLAGAFPDMKVTGLSLWRSEDSGVTLTLPAGPGSAGEYYCFRPVSGTINDTIQFKRRIVEMYLAWVAGGGL